PAAVCRVFGPVPSPVEVDPGHGVARGDRLGDLESGTVPERPLPRPVADVLESGSTHAGPVFLDRIPDTLQLGVPGLGLGLALAEEKAVLHHLPVLDLPAEVP